MYLFVTQSVLFLFHTLSLSSDFLYLLLVRLKRHREKNENRSEEKVILLRNITENNHL